MTKQNKESLIKELDSKTLSYDDKNISNKEAIQIRRKIAERLKQGYSLVQAHLVLLYEVVIIGKQGYDPIDITDRAYVIHQVFERIYKEHPEYKEENHVTIYKIETIIPDTGTN